MDIKRSLSSGIERDFHADCEDLAPDRKFVVYARPERNRVAPDIEAISLAGLAAEVFAA